MSNSVVVSLSGGMDSTTLLAWCLKEYAVIHAVSFQYPSKHGTLENQAVMRIEDHYTLSVKWISLKNVFRHFKSNLLLGQGEIPEGHYESESMKQTVVPGRNMIFASILAGYAESVGSLDVVLGVHAGDHAIYPDCRPPFIDAMGQAIRMATDEGVYLKAPFILKNKTSILAWGLKHNVPYHLTRTCYSEQQVACGKCGSCQERLEAFKNNGVEDPIEYESREILPKGK